MPNQVKSFGEVDHSKNRSRSRTGFGRERMELDSREKSRRNSMMRSKRFETQKMREIGRKEAGES